MLEAQVKEGIEWKKEWGRVGGGFMFFIKPAMKTELWGWRNNCDL
jgi:hypothetical protein